MTKGLAGVKLSGSPSRFGEKSEREISAMRSSANPSRSLYEKYG